MKNVYYVSAYQVNKACILWRDYHVENIVSLCFVVLLYEIQCLASSVVFIPLTYKPKNKESAHHRMH